MAYDEALAQRIRAVLSDEAGLVEKKMFGGVGFMLQGNMACGVHKDKLIVRVGKEQHDAAMARPYTLPFDITGRAMTGWVMLALDGVEKDDDLEAWVRQGVAFARSLPSK
jgi:TfoX/Sxy family transcriptional regulator of competence genes